MSTTSLFLCCNGSNGSTSFSDEGDIGFTPTSVGGAQVSTANPKYGTGALQMSSSGAYLQVADHATWDFGANDFCIECWANTTSTNRGGLICRGYNAPNPGGGVQGLWWIEMHNSSGNVMVGHYGAFAGGSVLEDNTVSINDGNWHHIAYTREGSTSRLFVDGTLKDSDTAVTVVTNLGYDLGIGYWSIIGGFVGQLDNVRITNGAAVYTSNFTPGNIGNFFTISLLYENAGSSFVAVSSALGAVGSGIGEGSNTIYWDDPSQDRNNVEITDEVMRVSAEPDTGNSANFELAIDSAVQLTTGDGIGAQGDVKVVYTLSEIIDASLLLHMDGSDGSTTFIDSSASAHTVTPNNITVTTSNGNPGFNQSAQLTVNSSYLSIPNSSDWSFGTGDFTIDFWWRPIATLPAGTSETLLATCPINAVSAGWSIYYYLGNLGFASTTGGGAWDRGLHTGAWTRVNNTWTHFAICRSGATLYIFANGTVVGSPAIANSHDTSNALYVAGDLLSNYGNPGGQLDEVRIVKGEALYVANFTPPTSPY